ncbi:C-Jun-amino-terminal kinase-interacting protein 4-like [Pyxicephalus adspersus]|uniref:C-Jun-amino-terminal kinase-interacting protein 4-like n=1 Tax=Pyxicephalus adspersus TaxID=30357 RepID=UPI003B5A6BDB
MELEDGLVYQEEAGASMSERVSALAASIYREMERLIGRYEEEAVKELMPLVVAVLENLEAACTERHEQEAELELLREDNEQLITQYEREKALRKHAEEKFIEFEDVQEQDKKELQTRVENLESQIRQLELKAKNSADQISRLEEREAELKKEYNALHQRHSEMIHNYMEHLERTKLQQLMSSDQLESTMHNRMRKERPISLGIFPLSPGDSLVLPDARGAETPGNGPWKVHEQNQARSNTSLKDELMNISQPGSKTVSSDADNMVHATSKDPKDEVIMRANLQNNNIQRNRKNEDVQVNQEMTSASTDTNDNEEKSEVQSIIESTPELDMDKDPKSCHMTSTPTKGIENKAFDRNTDSLFEELSSAGTDLIGDVDEGADLLGITDPLLYYKWMAFFSRRAKYSSHRPDEHSGKPRTTEMIIMKVKGRKRSGVPSFFPLPSRYSKLVPYVQRSLMHRADFSCPYFAYQVLKNLFFTFTPVHYPPLTLLLIAIILHQGRLLGLRANKVLPGSGNRPGSVIRVYGDENSDKVTPGTFIPYCSMAHAQLCFHGHRDAVKFFVAVPGQVICPSTSGTAEGDKSNATQQESNLPQKSMLVMSGGEGYIDFRMGDDGTDSEQLDESLPFDPSMAKVERSHLIVWQVMCNGSSE